MNQILHILLIEDSTSDAARIIHLLKRAFEDVDVYQIDTADQMLAALEVCAWDVILSDYYLPHFDAPTALALLKNSGLDIPFIVVSGTMGEETAVGMMKAGANDYLMKDKLLRLGPTIEREVREAQIRRERRQVETALTEAERQQQESQRLAQATIDALTAHICVLDGSGTVLAVNRAWREFGDANPPAPPNYALGSNYLQICDSAQGMNSAGAKEFASGLRTILSGEAERFQMEYPCNSPAGDVRWFISRVTRFAGDGSLRAAVAHENVTQRKLAEEALRRSEERYRKLIEESHELIFTHDFELNILSMNPAMENLLGIPFNPAGRLNLYQITAFNQHKRFMPYIHAISRQGIHSGEWYFATSHHTEVILHYQSTLINQPDQAPVVRCMAQDVTAQTLRELELEAIAAMTSTLRSYAPRQDILPVILQELTQLVSVDGSAIALFDAENNKARVILGQGDWKAWTGTVLSLSQGTFGQVYESNRAVIAEKSQARDPSDWPGPLGDIQTVVCIPLITRNQFIGALWVGRKGTFSQGGLRVLQTISDISASAILNAAQFQQIEDRVSSLTSLYDAGLAINSVLDPHSQLEFLSRIAMEELHADRIVFLRYFPDKACFRVDHCLGFDETIKTNLLQACFPAADNLDGESVSPLDWVRVNELPLNQPDTTGVPLLNLGDAQIHSLLLAPVKHGQNIRGILGVMSTRTNGFTPNQERMLVLFSNQAAVALENASLLSETRLQVERLRALQTVEETINTSRDLNLTADVLLEQITNHLNVDAASILLIDPQQKWLKLVKGRGFQTPALQSINDWLTVGLISQTGSDLRVIHVSRLKRQTDFFADWPSVQAEAFDEYFKVPLVAKGALKGFLELFSRSPLAIDAGWLGFMNTLADQAAIAIDNIQMFENLERSNVELTLAYDATIEGWSQAMEMRDSETEGHTRRVTEMAVQLAKALRLPEEITVHIRRGALLHDMGKLGVPDVILRKPESLTAAEWVEMKKHPEYAFQMLASIDYLRPALDIPYCHHEKWDGSGYPRGLKGEEIPLLARLFAVVDVWDALTSDRPYRPAWSQENAWVYIKEQAGLHFDPRIANIFLSLIQDGRMPVTPGKV